MQMTDRQSLRCSWLTYFSQRKIRKLLRKRLENNVPKHYKNNRILSRKKKIIINSEKTNNS